MGTLHQLGVAAEMVDLRKVVETAHFRTMVETAAHRKMVGMVRLRTTAVTVDLRTVVLAEYNSAFAADNLLRIHSAGTTDNPVAADSGTALVEMDNHQAVGSCSYRCRR